MPVNPKSLQNLRQNRPKVERTDLPLADIRTDPVPITESADIATMARPYVGEALETLVKVMRGTRLPPANRVAAASRILAVAQGGREGQRQQPGGAVELEALRRIADAIAKRQRAPVTLEGTVVAKDPA